MAQIQNAKALTESDGLVDVFNVNTVNKRIELPNGTIIQLYADAYTTAGTQISGSGVASTQSATAPVITNGTTIATAGVGVARVAPGGAVTGIILQAGTIPGQEVWVINESTGANTVTMASAGTSNVADGTSDVIAGLIARKYVWDSGTSLWYKAA